MRRAVLVVVVAVVGIVSLSRGAVAQSDPQDRAAALSTQIMSPFCPGLTLHDCPTQAADELRARIVTWADEGLSDDQILNRLEDEYGPNIRAVPRDGGAWWIWTIPALALAVGIAVAFLVARRWTAEEDEPRPDNERWGSSTPDERARLETELNAAKSDLWGRA